MSFENCKIENYATSILGLPDYPSEAGYTAENLKALFDARSDGEIKEKHNALVDAVVGKTAEVEARAKAYADEISEYARALADEAKASAKSYARDYADGAERDAKSYASSLVNKAANDACKYADGLGVNYDPAGSAAEAEARAKEYADGAIAEAIASIINLDEVRF